jgi:hypothetical protein
MNERIVCKPTPWFLLRAAAMLLLFGIFTVLFYVDGKWRYREYNVSYYLSQAFKQAAGEFKAKKETMSAEDWRAFAQKQSIDFLHRTEKNPDGELVPVPDGTPVPMPWPEVLHDFEKMKASLDQPPSQLFDDYRLAAGIKHDAPEHNYPARKIHEQWVVFWICLALTIGALVVLVRTIGRSIAIDDKSLYPADGGTVPFGDLVRLDLRKWETKGLAFAWAKTPAGGERRLRIDGLTYGGFKKEQDEPAERLMVRLRENFSGEVIEYVVEPLSPGAGAPPDA